MSQIAQKQKFVQNLKNRKMGRIGTSRNPGVTGPPNCDSAISRNQKFAKSKNRENLKIAISMQKSHNQQEAILRNTRDFKGSIKVNLRKRPMLVSAPPSGDKPKAKKREYAVAPKKVSHGGKELAPRVFQFVTALSGD